MLRFQVRCDEHAPGAVRAALADLQGLGSMLRDAMLVASELVTNAVRHSGCSEKDQLEVSVVAEDGLRITVIDPGSSGEPAKVVEHDPGVGRLNLRVVHHLVRAWGTERRSEGYVVWAELPGRT